MRLDLYLVEKGYAPTREKAQAIIMAGLVQVDGKLANKPGMKIREGQRVEVKEVPKYVSRGGDKLENALKRFKLKVEGMIALDVGSSTGGFTQCLLMHGVKKVYAVDVGRGQMDPKLRHDPRVILYEETDARELTKEHIPELVDLITVDVSFVSARKIVPHVLEFLKEDGTLLLLVKPQFEVGPERLRKGIVKEAEAKKLAVLKVVDLIKSEGFKICGVIKAKPKGAKGNEEFFVLAKKHAEDMENIQEAIDNAIGEAI
ncbi:MAG: TlyA family RNA methyltransferase [Aquificaceae bacterium]|nr:TlyA family RNA methyltransferase [Aquificaceae bacterium]